MFAALTHVTYIIKVIQSQPEWTEDWVTLNIDLPVYTEHRTVQRACLLKCPITDRCARDMLCLHLSFCVSISLEHTDTETVAASVSVNYTTNYFGWMFEVC